MIVKVCGVRTAEIARAAVAAGADWIGIVFVPGSVRNAAAAEADQVCDAVAGRADLVGVFVEPDPVVCNRIVRRHGLAAVQLHGAVGPEIVADIDVPVIRGINVGSAAQAYTFQWWPDGIVLLDADPEPGSLPGGTGRRVDPGVASEVARHRRIVLAGGLGPRTVAAAIDMVRPWGVDASSGLEVAPGVKDAGLVTGFVRAARAAADASGQLRIAGRG